MIPNEVLAHPWCATAFLDDNKKGMYSACPRKITESLEGDAHLFYASSHPIADSRLLAKRVLVHLLARIAQVFLTAITGLRLVVAGVFVALFSPIGGGWSQYAKGCADICTGLYLLTFGLVADGVLAVASPLVGICEAGRVIWSRALENGDALSVISFTIVNSDNNSIHSANNSDNGSDNQNNVSNNLHSDIQMVQHEDATDREAISVVCEKP